MKNTNFLDKVLLLSLVVLPLIHSVSFAMDSTNTEEGLVRRLCRFFESSGNRSSVDPRNQASSGYQAPSENPAPSTNPGYQAPSENPAPSTNPEDQASLPNPVSPNIFSRAYGCVGNQIHQHPYRSAAIALTAALLGYGAYKAYRWCKPVKKGAPSLFSSAWKKTKDAANWCWSHKKITVPVVGTALVGAAALLARQRNIPIRDGLTRFVNWCRTHKARTALVGGLMGTAAGCGLWWKYAAEEDDTTIKSQINEIVNSYHDAALMCLKFILGLPTEGNIQDSLQLLQKGFQADIIIQVLKKSNFKDEQWAQTVIAELQSLVQVYTEFTHRLQQVIQQNGQISDELSTQIGVLISNIEQRTKNIGQATSNGVGCHA